MPGITALTLLSAVYALGVPAAAQPEAPKPLVTRSEPQDWRLRTIISLGMRVDTPEEAWVHCPSDGGGATPVELAEDVLLDTGSAVGEIPVEEATVYFPIAGRSTAYEVNRRSLRAEFLYNGQPIPLRESIYNADASGVPLHSGAAYGIWSFGPAAEFVPNFVMQFDIDSRSWNISLDEEAARQVPWPTGDWPAEAAESLRPMLFTDRGFGGPYDPEPVREIVKRWTNGSPRSQPPLVLAKWLAGQLSTSFQPIGQISASDSVAANSVQSGRSVGAMQGINVVGAESAAKSMTGTPMDLPVLLAALYREAGLPARVVVGYVAGDEGGANDRVRRRDEPEMGLYAWVEFALYDERQSSLDVALNWIPVDILSMRAGNVGRRPLDQRWDGFGHGEYFNELVPIAYHLHPHDLPAISYGRSVPNRRLRDLFGTSSYVPLPSLWGWNVVPATPGLMHQTISFSVTTPSRTAEDARQERSGGRR